MDSLIQRIIVPVDFSPASERAARFACALARNLGSHLYLIHVVEAAGAKATHLADVCGPHQRRYLAAKNAMGDLVSRLERGAQITSEIRTGAVDEGLTSAVVAYGGDLVVMATHGRSGLPHLLFGSVAEHVIRTASCPVLVMRESGQVQMHRAAPESRRVAQVAQTA